MTAGPIQRFLFALYIALFFLYLLGPLGIMVISSFNTPEYPQVWPIEGFTTDWFGKLLADRDMMQGFRTSIWIGLCVTCLSVTIGLAGAIVMTQITPVARASYYLVVVSPVLTPGIIIGISTVVFWREMTSVMGTKFFYDGLILTVLAQSSFISAYCMLIILARLQRFDRSQEEAALDLGASYPQVFRQILLPFLRPALFSAAVLAFLSSFENYNTTTFSILADKTLTTVLAGRVRQGSTPAISALATLIVTTTLVAAVIYELIKRREDRRARSRRAAAIRAEEAELALGPAG